MSDIVINNGGTSELVVGQSSEAGSVVEIIRDIGLNETKLACEAFATSAEASSIQAGLYSTDARTYAQSIQNMNVATGNAGTDAIWDGVTLVIPRGDTGATGATGDNGVSVHHITRTAGDGSSGTTDTYTAWGDVGETVNLGTFDVYNGADGVGSGDLLAVNNLSDLADIPTARTNLGIASSADTYTNKTLNDVSNTVHADAVHYEVQATEALLAGDVLIAVGITDDTTVKVAKRSALNQPAIGIAETDIGNGLQGTAISIGVMTIANSGWSVGDVLYANATGGLTSTPTIADGNYNQPMAYVVKENNTWATVMVNIHSGHEPASLVSYGAGTVKDVLDALPTTYLTPTGDGSQLTGITATQVGAEPADATILKDADIGVTVASKTALDTTNSNVALKQTILQSSYNQIADATLGTGTHTFDFSQGDMQQLTVTGDITIAFSNFPTGKVCTFIIDAINWGDWTITLPAGVIASGSALAYTAGGTDRILVIKDKDDVYSMTIMNANIGAV